MIQTFTPVLFPPVLLATDGSPGARLAQSLVRPIVQSWLSDRPWRETAAGFDQGNLLTVLTVQPRSSRRAQRLEKKQSVQANHDESQPVAPVRPVAPNGSPNGQRDAGFTPSLDSLAALVLPDFPDDWVALQVRQGRPAVEILSYARTMQAGLIAVGHRGAGGMRELLLGSVSTAIARYAPCSVLVARSTANPPREPSLQHGLLVVDESTATQPAIAAVRQLIAAGIQQITLLHIQPPLNASYLFGPFVSPTPSWQLSQSLQTVQKEQSEEMVHQAEAALSCTGIDVKTQIRTGDPGPLICQIARESQADLVILGSDSTRRSLLPSLPTMRLRRHPEPLAHDRPAKGKAVLRNTRLSITEDYVIHFAPCPVLLCRAPER